MMRDVAGLKPITLPDLGASEQTVRVSTWLVQIGEDVVVGDPVVEVWLRGITFDVEAPSSGRLRRIGLFENDVVGTGDTLGWIEADVGEASHGPVERDAATTLGERST